MNTKALTENPRSWGQALDLEDVIIKRLEANCFGPRTIEIYGGAYHIARRYGEPSLQNIALGVIGAIKNAKYWAPEIKSEVIAQRFCNLFFVDYMLIEALIDMRFSELN